MTQFTKFTNLPIYSDPQRTAITNTLITDIPECDVRDDEGALMSMRYPDVFVLCTERTLEDGCELHILEEENRGWSIQHFDPNTKIRITERSNGDWDKYILVNKDNKVYFEVLEEHFTEDQISEHKKFIDCGTEYNTELYFNPEDKNYIFNVTSFMTDKMRSISKHFHSPKVVEDYESAYFSGKKEEVVNGINQLIARLIEVRQQINAHTTE